MSEFINVVRSAAEGGLDGVSDAVILAMGVVCGLLIIVSIFALGVSIFLAISYVRYNKKQNSCGMAIFVLKTEKKAQKRAYEIMKEEGLATEEELESCKKLFRLYNIEYINDMVIALLELIYRVLQIIAYVQNSSSSSSKQ